MGTGTKTSAFTLLGIHSRSLTMIFPEEMECVLSLCPDCLEDRSTTADLFYFLNSNLCVAHALRLRHLVGEVRLLEARGTHALVR